MPLDTLVRSALITFLAGLIATSSARAPKESTSLMPSWGWLEQKLEQDEVIPVDFAEMQRVGEYKRIVEQGTLDVFLEMTGQYEFPAVQLGGFYAIRDRYPDASLGAAFAVVSRSAPPRIMLYGQLYEFIRNERDAERFVEDFDGLVRYGRPALEAFNLILHFSPPEHVDQWFHKRDREVALPSLEAIALDALYAWYTKRDVEVTDQMRGRLLSYSRIPGTPRRIFVKWVDDGNENLLPALEAVLNNQKLSSPYMVIILDHRREFIVRHLSDLELRPEVREELLGTLQEDGPQRAEE